MLFYVIFVTPCRTYRVNIFLVFYENHCYITLFFGNQGGEMLYARSAELAKNVAYSLKPPLLKQQAIHEKQEAMNQRL